MRIGAASESEVRADGMRAIVIGSRFNQEIVQKLVDGAVAALQERGAADVRVVWVPGALELPVVTKAAIESSRPDIVVCVGCVIKGSTDHYDHVCRAAIDGIARVTLDTGVPIGNGVLTVATQAQAEERAGGAVGNKGAEAALAAIEAAQVIRRVRSWA